MRLGIISIFVQVAFMIINFFFFFKASDRSWEWEYSVSKKGPRTEPWGTPYTVELEVDSNNGLTTITDGRYKQTTLMTHITADQIVLN